MRLEVLAEATNKLLRIERPSAAELRQMLVIGCKELRMLMSDPTFFSELAAAQLSSESNTPEVRATFADLNRFAGFLDAEKKVLVEAGLDSVAVAALARQASDLRPLLAQRTSIDVETLRVALVKLANEVCNIAELTEPGESQEFRRIARPVLRRVALTLSGATIVSANIAATLHLGHVYAAASIGVGGAMIKDGVFGE